MELESIQYFAKAKRKYNSICLLTLMFVVLALIVFYSYSINSYSVVNKHNQELIALVLEIVCQATYLAIDFQDIRTIGLTVVL